MAHKVGRAVKSMKFSDIGSGKNWNKLTKGVGDTLGDTWNSITGQIDPGNLNYANWENQEYNQDWNNQAAQGTSQGYNAQGYQGQGYNAAQAGPAQGYDASTGTFQSGQAFQNVMDQAMSTSQDLMDPSGQWAKGQQSILAESTGQQMGQAQAQQSAQLAARGMGGGGLRGILGSQAQAQAGAAQRQGATDIATQGMGMGLQAMGQAGQMAGQQDASMLQQSLANQQAQNQASQFGAGAQNQFSLANQQAANQASQFGAAAQNTANQWSAGQQNQASQFGASAANQMSQFNAQQQQQSNQFNTSNQMNWQSWNASQDFAADQFNASQMNAQMQGNAANNATGISGVVKAGAAVKMFFLCIPERTKIDTPNGRIAIEDLEAGDVVNGYGNKPVSITQKHEYKENPELKRFLKIYFDDGDTIDICDMHKIKGIRSREYNVGDSLNGKEIVNIKWYDGVTRSYDLLTDDKGYRISGIPVNSMIEEMNSVISLVKEIR